MADEIELLSEEDIAHLERQRNWVREHYVPEQRHQYDTLVGKLSVLNTILENNWIEPQETWKLQSLGVTFGDVLAERFGLTWAMMHDEYGRDPCLYLSGTTIRIFPLTSISKRVERGESVDIGELYKDFESLLDDMRKREAPFH